MDVIDGFIKSIFPAPPPPPPPPSVFDYTDAPVLAGIILCWLVPLLVLLFSRLSHGKSVSPTAKATIDAKGKTVPKDFERRTVAQKADAQKGIDLKREALKNQVMLAAFIFVPHALAWQFQTAPTVADQMSDWARVTYDQLTDGKINPTFQLAVALLFIERFCYTWVHTFSPSFLNFCKGPIGRHMGKKPLDVVLTLFYINKVIQLGTFLTFYFYTLGFQSPWDYGFTWSKVTPFQWIWLVHAIVIGQGFNTAIYRAIGKAGVYYGYRLGEPVPWVTGFPFSVVPHPQYFGVCMCVIGVNIFVALPEHVAAGWFNLTAIQVLYYVYMGLVEDYL